MIARRSLLATVALLAAALSSCSTGPTGSTSGDGDATTAGPTTTAAVDANAFPVTIAHALGETTIEQEPVRIATVGWTDHDIVLSLGVVPVGATALTWGGNEGQSSDWFDEALAEAGGTAPVRYSDVDGVPVEDIAAVTPDLILATNSGITAEEYAALSKIAPVVAYPEAPWVTSWQDSLGIIGEALGRSTRAEEVLAETEQLVTDTAAAHPQLAENTFVVAYLTTTDLSTIGIYGREDNRVRMLEAFGLQSAPIVSEVAAPGTFYGSISAELASTVEADVLLTYAETEADLDTFRSDPLIGEIPAIKAGNAYAEVDKRIGLAMTNPSPISMPFIIENYLPSVLGVLPGS